MRDQSKGSAPVFPGVQSRKSTFTKSVDYFFDQPNVIRRPANKTASNNVPVLATFDADNAIVLANEALLKAVERNRRTRHQLCDEDVETLTHEFARVLQYREIFQDHLTQSDRIDALRKRRSQIVLRSTLESYTNHRLHNERQAEEVVQRVRMEILSAFDRAQHGSGLSSIDITERVEEFTAVFIKTLRQAYLSSASREFTRLKNHRSNNAYPTDGIKYGSGGARYKVLSMREMRWLFPVEQSSTLADLVDQMISFRMKIVVPLSDGDSH